MVNAPDGSGGGSSSSGSGGSSGPRLDGARSYIDFADRFDNFGQAFIATVSGIAVFAGSAVIALGESVVNLPVTLLDAFGIGGEAWVFALTRDPAEFVSASFQSAGDSLLTGPFAELGPFLPWIAAIVAIGVVMILTWYLDRRDSDVPGLGVDLPVIGNDEDGDSTDEE
ncbi:hypothetical protein C454_02850 [Haloferax gibbonsii ATCC 33959]|uniref:Uncharacterized protein n=1 Tax=Haloferax gibbonsii (strain ATCC 33959 / DSM 4427 / JCM 8863 / NBRC 102184 / NCIMB 2188 / Ma 2.38) TaxID=1227459 RepID=M0HML1_HALGM|nr:hypothetical protein C454_02850 [Haloferax gibbonsii ATCC 33959]